MQHTCDVPSISHLNLQDISRQSSLLLDPLPNCCCSDVLALGNSKPWQETLAMLTKGKTKELDARPLLEYFQPLYDWLLKQNKDVPVGWRSETSTACPQPLVRDDDDGGHQDP